MAYNADEIMNKNGFLERIDELKKNYDKLQEQEESLIKLKRQIEIEIGVLTDELRKYLRTKD